MKIDFESLDGNYFPFALTVSNLKPEVRNLSQSRERYSDYTVITKHIIAKISEFVIPLNITRPISRRIKST